MKTRAPLPLKPTNLPTTRNSCRRTSRSPPTMANKSPTATAPQHIANGLATVPEVRTPILLPVTGKLPSYLTHSTLYRNGPGRYEAVHKDGAPYTVRHWFDGLSMIHAFTIDAEENTVHYKSAFTAAPVVRAIENTPKWAYPVFAFGPGDPCRSILGKFFQLWAKPAVDPLTRVPPTNCNVTIQQIPGKGPFVARTDTAGNFLLNPDTLELDHFFNFSALNNELSGPFSAAHGHYDDDTGDFLNFNYDLKGPGSVKYNVFRISKIGETEILASFQDLPCYVHSFATTPNYVVMCLWPLRIEALKLLFSKSLMDGMQFHPEGRTKFVVVSRHLRRVVATYDTEAFFCFHTINAFERDDAIHIDLCKYKDASILDQFALDKMRSATEVAESDLTRLSLEDLSAAVGSRAQTTRPARRRMVSQEPIELPCIHPGYKRKEHRFVYGVSNTPGKMFDDVAKVDVRSGKRKAWSAGNGIVGEPIFVPDPNGKAEDDGVLLVVVLDGEKQRSAMVVLDAKTMGEVARASVPQVVPLGFHGKFSHT